MTSRRKQLMWRIFEFLTCASLFAHSLPAHATDHPCPAHWAPFIGLATDTVAQVGHSRRPMILFFDSTGAIYDCIPVGFSADVLTKLQSAVASWNTNLQATIGKTEFEKLVVPNSCSFSIDETSIGQMVAIRLPNQADIMSSKRCTTLLTRLEEELGKIIRNGP